MFLLSFDMRRHSEYEVIEPGVEIDASWKVSILCESVATKVSGRSPYLLEFLLISYRQFPYSPP